MDPERLAEELGHARREIADLHRRLERLEATQDARPLPRTMLLDESFLKRAFAVYGHYLVAGLIIGVPIFIVTFLLLGLLE